MTHDFVTWDGPGCGHITRCGRTDPGPHGDEGRKPTAGFENLSREEAQRSLDNRALKLKGEIRALPVAEKLRLAAEFLDAGEKVVPGLALSVVRLALAEMDTP